MSIKLYHSYNPWQHQIINENKRHNQNENLNKNLNPHICP